MIEEFNQENTQIINQLESWGAEPKLVLDETFLDDIDFYRSCLKKFSIDPLLETLQKALLSNEKELAIRAAHTLKGNADYLGLFPIMDAGITILTDLRADQFDRAKADMEDLESAFDQFKKIMSPYLD